MREIIVRPIFKQPNGYWWAYSMIQPNRIFSLHTRDGSKAQAAYNEQLGRLRRFASIDPAGDAGMDNPPEPGPQTTTDTAVEALHRRVAELEDEVARLRPIAKAAVELRLDAGRERAATEAAEQRVEELERELSTLRATLKITDW